jgi:hypothetical protein
MESEEKTTITKTFTNNYSPTSSAVIIPNNNMEDFIVPLLA